MKSPGWAPPAPPRDANCRKATKSRRCIRNYHAASDRLDILVNCAGVGSYGRVEDLSDEQWRTILAVDLHAPIQLIRGFLPMMVHAEGVACF